MKKRPISKSLPISSSKKQIEEKFTDCTMCRDYNYFIGDIVDCKSSKVPVRNRAKENIMCKRFIPR